MKRDMDLIRKILLKVEDDCDDNTSLEIDGYSKKDVNYHIYLLNEAGLIEALICKPAHCFGDEDFRINKYKPDFEEMGCIIYNLTWNGHEFLDACRDEGIWAQTKEKISRVAISVPVSVLSNVLTAVIQSKLNLG